MPPHLLSSWQAVRMALRWMSVAEWQEGAAHTHKFCLRKMTMIVSTTNWTGIHPCQIRILDPFLGIHAYILSSDSCRFRASRPRSPGIPCVLPRLATTKQWINMSQLQFSSQHIDFGILWVPTIHPNLETVLEGTILFSDFQLHAEAPKEGDLG